jgi:hypothetical protein
MADATLTVAALNTLEPERRDAVLKAARKLEILADALVTVLVHLRSVVRWGLLGRL